MLYRPGKSSGLQHRGNRVSNMPVALFHTILQAGTPMLPSPDGRVRAKHKVHTALIKVLGIFWQLDTSFCNCPQKVWRAKDKMPQLGIPVKDLAMVQTLQAEACLQPK